MVDVLAGLLHEESADRSALGSGHFFDDLGANSMTMAHFCAKLRKQPGAPSVSMRDIYARPSIRQLASSLTPTDPSTQRSATQPVPVREPEPTRASTTGYICCGLAQLILFIAYSYTVMAVLVPGYRWIADGVDLVDIYLRSVLVGGSVFLAMCLLPVVAKWVLIGRWTTREFPVWSLGYLRFWLVKTLVHMNPMILFVGNPLYVLYLRALGARIGRGVTILSRSIPVCTDLLTVGDGAVIRKDCLFAGYRAYAGSIQTGPVTIGAGALIGEKTVLDIHTAVGSHSQLGHTSSLQSGERVPDDEHWHGSPAQRTDIDYRRVPERSGGSRLRAAFAVGSLLQTLLITVPVAAGGAYLLITAVPEVATLVEPVAGASLGLYIRALLLAAILAVGLGVIMLALIFGTPRIARRVIRAGQCYPLYGPHFSLHRTTQALTNRRLLTWWFGDSSFITGYLTRLGYDLGAVEQTGSNFGTEVQHESPNLVRVGGGTMVADGLSILNADYSSTTFRLSEVAIGGHSFLGNNIAFPAGGRIGENCLLATKVMVPLDGPVRHGVGLLGSPPFEIPRTVERDARFDHLRSGAALQQALRAKNRFNLRSMILMMGLRFVHLFLIGLLGLITLDLLVDGVAGQLLAAAYAPLSLMMTAFFWIAVERLICRFRPLQPQLRSIYDPYFWWHERLWKVPDHYLNAFNGTPMKNIVWRLLGVRIGARVFDDGAYLTERTLTTIGDDAVLNVGSKLQCHSQEDGTFKSDRTRVGRRATLGVGAFVHYGVEIGDGALIMADSFLMKGEDVPDLARWGGNPAETITATALPDGSEA